MTRRSRGWVALGAALTLTLAGCALHTAHEGAAEAPKEIRFSVRVTPPSFAPGERVSLEASMFNDSDDEYKEKFHTRCIWDYEVTTLDGAALRATRACIPLDTTLVLAPGELGVIVREWSGRERYFNTAQPLTPGRYQVVAGFLDENHRVIPMSAPVEIQVLNRSGAQP